MVVLPEEQVHDLIANLEAEIDGLRDSAERCRKIDMAAKAAMGLALHCCSWAFSGSARRRW